MQKNPPVSLYLDTRRTLLSGKAPLTIRVTFIRFKGAKKIWDQRYFPTGLHFTEEEYKKITTSKRNKAQQNIKTNIKKIEARAQDIVDTNPYISPDLFRALFTGAYTRSGNIEKLFNEKITTLTAQNKLASASLYDSTLKSLLLFAPGINIYGIDAQWLRKYEHWMANEGCRKHKKAGSGNSISTIGLYLRNLRHIFNVAVDRKIIDRDLYPFGKGRYVIPQSNNFKKALGQRDKKKLLHAKPLNPEERRRLAHWSFSYYCQGINFKDMAYLQENNFTADIMAYIRQKTKTTTRQVKTLIVPLRKEALQILKQYGQHKPYVFGIITGTETPEQQRKKIAQWIKDTNRCVSAMAKRVGLSISRVTTYTARHTVATTLLEGGADLRDIKETFGHSSFNTTERYVASLDIAKKKKLVEML